MTCHDCDPRYADPECRARVAALYLPLLGIVMDSLGQLHTGPHDNSKGNFQRPQRMQYIDSSMFGADPKSAFNEESENQLDINQKIAMTIAGSFSPHLRVWTRILSTDIAILTLLFQ